MADIRIYVDGLRRAGFPDATISGSNVSFGKFDPKNANLDQLQTMISNMKSSGIADDDLKPLISSITSAGYNVGQDYSIKPTAGNGGAGGPGTYTPAPPPPDNSAKVPVNPNLPTDVPGATIPGPSIPLNSDQGTVEQEAAREKQQTLDATNAAAALRTQGISSLSDILTKQNQAQFNYDLPGIKEDLAGSGLFSSPSALAAAVARESGMLGANTQSTLAQAGLGNIDLQAEGLLGANQNSQALQQGGLQRTFSLADYAKQSQLAQTIGSNMLPQSPGFSLSGALGGAGTGAVASAPLWAKNPGIGAGITLAGALGGGAESSGTYICTRLNELGLMTRDEVEKVHDKIFSTNFTYLLDLILYGILAPSFIKNANESDFDWKALKPRVCDEILACETSKEAFEKYRTVCYELFGLNSVAEVVTNGY